MVEQLDSQVCTKKGDAGNTSMLYGTPVSKSDLRLEAYGTIDELNASLGVIRAIIKEDKITELLLQIQKYNFLIGSELATTKENNHKLKDKINSTHVTYLESYLVELENTKGIVFDWAIPGNSLIEAKVDLARTICRRAERNVVRLHEVDLTNNSFLIKYLNRLSDLLWVLGRYVELKNGEI